MVPADIFKTHWPSARVILQALNVPAEALESIENFNIRNFKQRQSRKPCEGALHFHLFTRGWFQPPQQATLWFFEGRGHHAPALKLLIHCERFRKPDDHSEIMSYLEVYICTDHSGAVVAEVIRESGIRFTLPYKPKNEREPVHLWLAADHFTPMMRPATLRLLQLTPQSFAAKPKSPRS